MRLIPVAAPVVIALAISGCGSETPAASTPATTSAAVTDSAMESHNTTDAVHENGAQVEPASVNTTTQQKQEKKR